MGLGKTVEVLGCMLHNPRTDVPKPEKLPIIIDEARKEDSKKGKKKEKKSKGKKEKGLDKCPKQYEREPDSDTGSTIIYSGHMDSEASDSVQSRDKQENQTNVSDEPIPSTSTAGEQEVLTRFENEKNDGPCQSTLAGSVEISGKDSGKLVTTDMSDTDKSMENLDDKSQVSANSDQEDGESEVKDEADSFDEIKGKADNILINDNAEGSLSEKDNTGKSNVMKRKRSEINLSTMGDSQKRQKNIFTEMPASQRECFECICGATEAAATKKDAKKHPVQCLKCSLWQHAECVNYDLKEVYRGEFKCPHCHVSSVSTCKTNPYTLFRDSFSCFITDSQLPTSTL